MHTDCSDLTLRGEIQSDSIKQGMAPEI